MKSSVLFASGCMYTKSSGPYLSLKQTVQTLSNSGHEITVLGTGAQKTCDVSTDWQVEAYAFRRYGPFSIHFAPGIRSWLKDCKPRWHVASLQGAWLYPNAPVSEWCRHHQIPYQIVAHGTFNPVALGISTWKKQLAFHTFLKKTFQEATCYQALSEIEYQNMRDYGIKKPICIVGNGIEIANIDTLPPIEQILPRDLLQRRTCLYLGRLHPIKGLERLIEAWAHVKPSDEWQLVIAGDGDPTYCSELEAQVEQLDAQEVKFVGFVTGDVKTAWLYHADFTVLPSYSEAFPMSTLESLSLRTPVLLTEACGFRDVSSDGAGLEVPSSVIGLGDGLQAMLSMPEAQLKQMGESGYSLVKRKYDWQIICNQLSSVYGWMRGLNDPPEFLRFD